MRKEFKKTKINNSIFAYPVPVIKELKYLIFLEERFLDFFIDSWKNGFLVSPDKKPDYLSYMDLHSDQKTSIYKISYDKLYFNFIDANNEKALNVKKLLNSKIISFLKEQEGSEEELKKTFLNQTNCRVCLDLGMGNSEIQSWMFHLINRPL